MSEYFYRKKLLLAERDALLEELGLESFRSGDLPSEFRNLPQEFRGMDVLLLQLRDRQRQLKEDHDLIHQDYLAYMAQIHKLENEYGYKIQPLRRELNEVQLNIQYAQDQLRKNLRKSKDGAELEHYKDRALNLQKQITAMEKARNGEIAKIHMKLDPIGTRLQVYDNAIRKVREESEHLSSTRARRMRDLGYWNFSNGSDEPGHDKRFDKLQGLINALSSSKKEAYEEEQDAPKRSNNNSWLGFAIVASMALLLVVIFRTQYRHEQISFPAIVESYLHDGSDYRFYLDLDLPNAEDWRREITPFSQLPGGEVLDEISITDVRHYITSRADHGTGEMRFCGIRFRHPRHNLVNEWSRLGWRHYPTKGNWEAMTDDSWAWILLDAQTFFLIRLQDMETFEEGRWNGKSDPGLIIEKWVAPFSSDNAILRGLNLMRLNYSQAGIHVELSSNHELDDGALRQKRLQQLSAETVDGPPSWIKFQNDQLKIQFPLDYFSPNQFQDPKLLPTLNSFINGILDQYQLELNKWVESEPAAESDQTTKDGGWTKGPGLMVMQVVADQLKPFTSMKLSGELTSLAFRKSDYSLIVGTGQQITRYQLQNRNLIPLQTLSFQNKAVPSSGLAGFKPGSIFFDRQEDFALVLEKVTNASNPRLLLLRGLDLEPVWVGTLPADVQEATSAVWDASGQQVYVSVAARDTGGGSARAVLIYRREKERLSLTQFVNASTNAGSSLRIPGLAQPSENQLLLYQLPQHRFSRYVLEESTYLQAAELALKPLSNREMDGSITHGPALELSRTREMALLLDLPLSQADESSKALFLIDLQTEVPSIASKLGLVGAPFALQRIPLRDSYWVSVPTAHLLMQVKIENKRVLLQSMQYLDAFSPDYFVSDEWGDVLFLAGKR